MFDHCPVLDPGKYGEHRNKRNCRHNLVGRWSEDSEHKNWHGQVAADLVFRRNQNGPLIRLTGHETEKQKKVYSAENTGNPEEGVCWREIEIKQGS